MCSSLRSPSREKLVCRELSQDRAAALAILQQMLAKVEGSETARVRLPREVFALVEARRDAILEPNGTAGCQLEFVPDDALKAGDVLIETDGASSTGGCRAAGAGSCRGSTWWRRKPMAQSSGGWLTWRNGYATSTRRPESGSVSRLVGLTIEGRRPVGRSGGVGEDLPAGPAGGPRRSDRL